jgi:FMN phosphatase YigB (HAD superfamily)
VRAVDCVALDYGQTLSAPASPGTSSPVDLAAVPAVRALAARGVRLILASNTRAGQDRRPELAAAGLSGLFAAVLLSSELGFAKPSCPFFAAVAAAAGCRSPGTTSAATSSPPSPTGCARPWSVPPGCARASNCRPVRY